MATDISQFSTSEVHVPSAATAAVLTFAAGGARDVHVVSGFAYSYSATPTGGRLTIADGADTVLDIDVPTAGDKILTFDPPRKGHAGRAMVVTLASGAGAVVGKLNSIGHWMQFEELIGEFLFNDESQSGLALLLF